MTLKEAYDKAKEEQRIRRKAYAMGVPGYKKISTGDPSSLSILNVRIEIQDAIADDWEIKGQK